MGFEWVGEGVGNRTDQTLLMVTAEYRREEDNKIRYSGKFFDEHFKIHTSSTTKTVQSEKHDKVAEFQINAWTVG